MTKIITPVEIDENADVCSILHMLADDVGWKEVLQLTVECACESGMDFETVYDNINSTLYALLDIKPQEPKYD